MARLAGSAALVVLLAPAIHAADWPHWRGPNYDGVTRETGWDVKAAAGGPKELWRAKVGRGFAAPAISDGRVYLLSTDAANVQREFVQCFDAVTGKELWKQGYEIKSVTRGVNPSGGTCAVTNGRVFAYGAAMNLHALDAKTGEVLWHRDLMTELPGQPTSYGFQLSPIVHDGVVMVPALIGRAGGAKREAAGGPYPGTGGALLGFDSKTGKEVWRNTAGASAWSSPVLATINTEPTLVHLTGSVVLGVNPKDGKTRWTFEPKAAGLGGQDMCASPVIVGDLVVAPIHMAYGTTAKGTAGTACFRVKGDKTELEWKSAAWCHWFQSAAVWDGRLHGYDERGTFYCFDLKTGKELWKSRELGSTGQSGGGLLIANGVALAIDSRLDLYVAELGARGAKVLGSSRVLTSAGGGHQAQTSPVLLDGLLYCRNHTQFVCFDLRAKKP
jgi:outer membrane protein assembly factor BamB